MRDSRDGAERSAIVTAVVAVVTVTVVATAAERAVFVEPVGNAGSIVAAAERIEAAAGAGDAQNDQQGRDAAS